MWWLPITLIVVALLGVGFSMFMLARNQHVYAVRWAILHDETQTVEQRVRMHDALPSYDNMLHNPKYYLLWTTQHWLAWVQRKERI